jgi:hypothetical protein
MLKISLTTPIGHHTTAESTVHLSMTTLPNRGILYNILKIFPRYRVYLLMIYYIVDICLI